MYSYTGYHMKMMKEIPGNLSLENSWVQLKNEAQQTRKADKTHVYATPSYVSTVTAPIVLKTIFELLALLKFVVRSTYSSIFMNYCGQILI